MAPKRGFFPLFLLLCLSAVLLFSVYRSSLPLFCSSTNTPLPNLKKPQIQNLDVSDNLSKFTLTIKVLTYDRLPSLSRCLRSLSAAHYDNHRVNIHIFIDHFKVLDQNHNGSEYLDQKLNESRRILDFVDGFDWRFGEKVVHYRTGNVGLQAQWLEAWWPVSDDEFAFVVEDDIEVSPLYYRFLRGLIVNYYYNASNFSPHIYGASLQRPRFVPGKHGNKLHLDEGTHLFLYQLVGTWGQLLFPRPWKEFRLWYDIHKIKGVKPILDGMVTTGWYKKLGEKIWTPWFIKFIHSRGYFNLYTNFSHETALSVSHRDAGVNYGKTAGPDSNLMQEGSAEANFLEMQPLSNLKWYDFCFREVIPERVIRDSHELQLVLKTVQKGNSVLLVYGTSETFTQNLLCHFERLNIRNYIFMGPDSSFLLELARRGHPVIDMDKFLDSINDYKSMKPENSRLVKETLAKAYLIKKSLELGYNTWLLDQDMLPLKEDSFFYPPNSATDFYVGKSLRLLFARSSSSTLKVWTNGFVKEIAQMAKAESRFVPVVTKLLESRSDKLQVVDENHFSMKIDSSDVNSTVLGDGKRVVFWGSDTDLDVVHRRLDSLGLWIIDRESHCTAVFCHGK